MKTIIKKYTHKTRSIISVIHAYTIQFIMIISGEESPKIRFVYDKSDGTKVFHIYDWYGILIYDSH